VRQLSNIQLQQQIIHYKSEMEKYKKKCERLENGSRAQHYVAIKKENDLLQSRLQTYLEELEIQTSERNTETSRYQALLSAQEREVKKLRYILNQVKDQLRTFTTHYVSGTEKQTERFLDSRSSLEHEILSLQVENSYLLKEKDFLLKANQEVQKQLYKKEIQIWELEALLEDVRIELVSRENDLHIEKCVNENQIHRLLDDNETLKNRLYLNEIELFESHNLLMESKILYESVNKRQIEDLERAGEVQKENESSIQRLQEELKRMQEDKNNFTRSLQSVRMNIKDLKDKVFEYDEEESISTKDTLKNYENTIQHLQFTNSLLNEEINKLKNKPGP
jgi:chromosome segregation ATPase